MYELYFICPICGHKWQERGQEIIGHKKCPRCGNWGQRWGILEYREPKDERNYLANTQRHQTTN